MTNIRALCGPCSRVPLDGPVSASTWELGSWKQLQESDCPFCELVLSAFHRLNQITANQDYRASFQVNDAKIYWARNLGPYRRGAFAIFPRFGGVWICKAATSMSDLSGSDDGFLRPIIDAQLDIGRLSSWISTCTDHHSGQCCAEIPSFEQVFPHLPCLRLIDVERGSLVELRSIPRYVTLSYVWGDSPTLRLTNTNRLDLMKPGAIERARRMIPRTIRDAIQLVKKLGVQYIWTDVLCLIQNDTRDVTSGVNVMDQVFEKSWLTIIAACGHNANSALPGVHEGSRPRIVNASKITEDASFGVYVELDRLLEKTVYASRAWTFQEQLLARRAIYFVGNHIYFRCREAIFPEQSIDRLQRVPDLVEPELRISAIGSMREPTADYEYVLRHYTQRSLSDQGDALRALAGVIRRLEEKMRCCFLQGLPTALFDAFILFKQNATGVLRRRKGFPSYSWTGWRGGISIKRQGLKTLHRWLEERTWIVWYERSPSGEVKLVWDPGLLPDDQKPFPGYGQRHPLRAPEGLLKDKIVTRTDPTRPLPFDIPALDYHILQFWTLSLNFKLGIKDIFSGTARIVGKQGVVVGDIILDGVEDTMLFNRTDPLEFILLSIAGHVELIQYTAAPEYHVMLLEWDGPVAERRGIGTIKQSAIEQGFAPGPEWKEIILG